MKNISEDILDYIFLFAHTYVNNKSKCIMRYKCNPMFSELKSAKYWLF